MAGKSSDVSGFVKEKRVLTRAEVEHVEAGDL